MTEKLYYTRPTLDGEKEVEHTRLHHRRNDTDSEFFRRIEQYGGWPLEDDQQYVGFEHTDERRAGFTDKPYSTGMWTTIYHRDDYLWWKISDRRKDKIARDIRNKFANEMLSRA